MASAVQLLPSYRSRFLWLDRERGLSSCIARRIPVPKSSRKRSAACCAAHGSRSDTSREVRNKGDFVVRTVIDRDLIFNRDVDGKVNAFFNTCRHRGAAICREPRGNRKRFVCPYHGWAYKSSGELFDQHAKLRLWGTLQRGRLLRSAASAADRAARADSTSSTSTRTRSRSTITSQMQVRCSTPSPISPPPAWKWYAVATSTRSRPTTS